MQNDSFIRVMHRLFSWLFFGSIALLLLAFVAMPVALTWQEIPTANRVRQVRYDTIPEKNSGHSSYSTPATDNTGLLISKIDWRDNYLTYYGEYGETVARLRFSDIERAADGLQLRRKKHARQIDSVLAAIPSARIHQLPDRWLIESDGFSGFSSGVTIPYNGSFFSKKKGSLYPPSGWHRIISYKPAVTVQANRDNSYPCQLNIRVHRWSDLTPSVWPLFILSSLMSLFTAGLFLLIVHWFRAIFADLLGGHYFEQQIVQRVRYIGWLCIGMFIIKNVLDVVKPFLAQHYLESQGYQYVKGWWSGPDYWLWLWGGLVLLVFSRIFSYGNQLQREHDLTI